MSISIYKLDLQTLTSHRLSHRTYSMIEMGVSGPEIIIIIIVIILVAIYAIAVFIMYDKGIWFFQDWEQPVPAYACQPLISIKPLTTAQQQNIQNIIANPSS